MKLIRILLETIGWCQIVLGATVAAALPAGLLYYLFPNDAVKIIAIVIISIGFLIGVVWGTRIWMRTGTIEWLGRIRRIS